MSTYYERNAEVLRKRKRDKYRIANGIPLEASLYAIYRTPSPRRGTGNKEGFVAMAPDDWERLERLQAGTRTRGEVIADALKRMEGKKP